jgi:predicted ATPase
MDKQPEQSYISPSEAENRTLRAVRNFLKYAAFDYRPLVIFIDDLQWSSLSELSVLMGLISGFKYTSGSSSPGSRDFVKNCLIIISYRNNEIDKEIITKLDDSLAKIRRTTVNSEIRGAVEIQVGQLLLVRQPRY